MNALTKARKELREVASDYAIKKAIREILAEEEETLEELLKEQLMAGKMAGSRNREKEISPEYSNDIYARKKQRMNANPKYKTPDLRLSGDFQDSIDVEVVGQRIIFDATDWKKDKLIEKYGQVLKLSKERWRNFNETVVEPKLRAKILAKVKR